MFEIIEGLSHRDSTVPSKRKPFFDDKLSKLKSKAKCRPKDPYMLMLLTPMDNYV